MHDERQHGVQRFTRVTARGAANAFARSTDCTSSMTPIDHRQKVQRSGGADDLAGSFGRGSSAKHEGADQRPREAISSARQGATASCAGRDLARSTTRSPERPDVLGRLLALQEIGEWNGATAPLIVREHAARSRDESQGPELTGEASAAETRSDRTEGLVAERGARLDRFTEDRTGSSDRRTGPDPKSTSNLLPNDRVRSFGNCSSRTICEPPGRNHRSSSLRAHAAPSSDASCLDGSAQGRRHHAVPLCAAHAVERQRSDPGAERAFRDRCGARRDRRTTHGGPRHLRGAPAQPTVTARRRDGADHPRDHRSTRRTLRTSDGPLRLLAHEHPTLRRPGADVGSCRQDACRCGERCTSLPPRSEVTPSAAFGPASSLTPPGSRRLSHPRPVPLRRSVAPSLRSGNPAKRTARQRDRQAVAAFSSTDSPQPQADTWFGLWKVNPARNLVTS